MYVLVTFCYHIKTIYLYISLLFLPVFLDKFNRLWAQTSQNCEVASKILLQYIFLSQWPRKTSYQSMNLKVRRIGKYGSIY